MPQDRSSVHGKLRSSKKVTAHEAEESNTLEASPATTRLSTKPMVSEICGAAWCLGFGFKVCIAYMLQFPPELGFLGSSEDL